MIVTITMNPSVDVNTRVRSVVPEEKLRCAAPGREAGGGGINVARGLKRLGDEVTALFPCGGTNGRLLQDLLRREDIRIRPVPVAEMTRQNVTVYEETTGRQYRFVMPGARFQGREWRQVLRDVERFTGPADYCVISGSLPPGLPPDFYAAVVRICRRKKVRVIVDSSQQALRHALRAGVFLIKPNMRELGDLAGRQIIDERQMADIASRLLDRGQCEHIVVSLGAGGVAYFSRESRESFRSPTVPVNSKVGAGDSMVAGIVHSLSSGASVREAVLYGVAAGAAAVMTPGTELFRPRDAEKLYRRLIREYGKSS